MKTRSGFTLFELLAVLTIIGIVLAVTVGSFTGWGDVQAVRGSAEIVEAAIMQACDYAVSQRVPVRFEYQTYVTNTLKQITVFQLVREPSVAVATNYLITAVPPDLAAAIDDPSQRIGPLQRLPGHAWLLNTIQNSKPTLADGYDRFVFLPNGKVFSPSGRATLYVVSRKTRSDNKPNMIYQIETASGNGAVTLTKRYPEDF